MATIACTVYEQVAFTSGADDIDVGDTLTQGAVTADILAVNITSGSLGAGTAAGTLNIHSRAGGNFAAGAATTTGSGTLTISGEETLVKDEGAPIPPNWMEYVDRNLQVLGTAGAAFSLLVDGGRDGTNYSTLNDATGTTIDFSGEGIKQVQEITPYTRPRVADGEVGVTDVNVVLVVRRERGGEGI
jgi:hypothetical protein